MLYGRVDVCNNGDRSNRTKKIELVDLAERPQGNQRKRGGGMAKSRQKSPEGEEMTGLHKRASTHFECDDVLERNSA